MEIVTDAVSKSARPLQTLGVSPETLWVVNGQSRKQDGQASYELSLFRRLNLSVVLVGNNLQRHRAQSDVKGCDHLSQENQDYDA